MIADSKNEPSKAMAPGIPPGIMAPRIMAPRIMALWFPHLGVQRILRQRLGRSWRSNPVPHPPLVISRRENNTQRIVALDDRAGHLGLKAGMGIADARAMHPSLDVAEADADADGRLLESLADWCDRYTPLVALDGEDGLFLDISGCAHLWGGEKSMLDDVLSRFFHQGFNVRAALASTPGAAWAAARFPQAKIIIEAGGEEKAITPLPIAALRLEPATRKSLESVGLCKVGALFAAPRAPIVRRFGKAVVLRLDQALGHAQEPISPRLPVGLLSAERHFPEPIFSVEDIESLTAALADTLKDGLERRGEGARLLELALFRVDGAVLRIRIALSLPCRDPARVRRLCRERLAALEGRLDVGFGFDLVRLTVLSASLFQAWQGDLIGSEEDGETDMALFADRLRARLGATAVMQPVLRQSHVPERAVTMLPFFPREDLVKAGGTGAGGAARPLLLFSRPEPVEVTAEVPEGAPHQFRWRRALYRVTRSEGPERIAPEWWRADADDLALDEQDEEKNPAGAATPPTRDYFRVEDAQGRRYWLFRQGLYDPKPVLEPRWFMHGVFA